MDGPIWGRRDFIAATSLLMFEAGLFEGSLLAQTTPTLTPELLEELTPEELKRVESSTMAKELKDSSGKGYNCAESVLMASLRYLGKPEDLVWVAGGFGGGMAHQDLCGFLTGGIMGIGLQAGMLPMERRESKKRCRQMVNQYWQDFEGTPSLLRDSRRAGGIQGL